MPEFLEGIGSASLWTFWAPVLVWSGLAGVAAFVLARARGLHPIAGYRLRQALLLALPVSVLAAPLVPGLFAPASVPAGPVPSATGSGVAAAVSGGVAVLPDPGPGWDTALVLLGAATVGVLLLAVARLAILAADIRQLRRLRRVARRVDDPAPCGVFRALAEQVGVRRPVELLEGPPDSAPMTFGARRPVILVPRAMLDAPDSLGPVLAHELVHIRRADYAWAMVDCLISAAFAFHPLVWLLRRGIERCRETSCDAEVVARGIVRPQPYAELLAHTHKPSQFPMPAVAASMSAPPLTLKERLEAMKNFAHRRLTSRQRAAIVIGAGAVCLVVALAGACAIRTDDEAPRDWQVTDVVPTEALTDLSDLELVEVREYVEGLEADRSDETYYTIPRLNDESVGYFYNATEEDVLKELARLDVQVQYLQEQIDATRAAHDAIWESEPPADDLSGLVRRGQELAEKLDLLKSMRTERVRMYETVKLEYETQKRLGAEAQAPPLGRPVF